MHTLWQLFLWLCIGESHTTGPRDDLYEYANTVINRNMLMATMPVDHTPLPEYQALFLKKKKDYKANMVLMHLI